MMSDSGFAHGLELIASVIFLIWCFYGPWNRFLVDLARQNLFEIRNDIFLMAADGDIKFSSDIYKMVRDRLNRMIRYCDGITMFGIVVAFVFAKKDQQPDLVDPIALIRSLPDKETSKELELKYNQAFRVMLGTTILRSAILILVITLLSPLLMIIFFMINSSRQLRFIQATRQAVEYDLEHEVGAQNAT